MPTTPSVHKFRVDDKVCKMYGNRDEVWVVVRAFMSDLTKLPAYYCQMPNSGVELQYFYEDELLLETAGRSPGIYWMNPDDTGQWQRARKVTRQC